ncbi:MAG: hypothetical protein GY945_05495 [Rhodobacteraceae bacterium]|nr:hypothetical protein [Paracoccaceae bacterium]
MKILKLTSITAAFVAALSGVALAGSYTPPPIVPPLAPPPPAAHDWTGMYGDLYAGHWIDPAVGNYFGANIGYLAGGGAFLFGGELGLIYDPSLDYTQYTLDLRVGAPVGDNAMVFANIGLGQDDVSVTFGEYSIGGQYAFASNVYVRGEVIGQTAISGASGTTSAVRLGLGWGF